MAKRKVILIVSGPIASGKSTIVKRLVSEYKFNICKTSDTLKGIAEVNNKPIDRISLQQIGDEQDVKTDGRWVLDLFQHDYGDHFANNSLESSFYIVDSARILKQIEHFRHAYSFSVYHIHLTAPDKDLKERFLARPEAKKLSKTAANKLYKEAKSNKTENNISDLSEDADLTLDTKNCTQDDVFVRVASFLKLLAPTSEKLVDVLVGAQFGSEGKGQIAAYMAPDYDCLVRVGGPNAGHTVFETPESHVFHSLPSGCFRNLHAKIILGPGSVIHVEKLLEEIGKYPILDEVSDRLIIDENAIVISDADIKKEQKLKDNIGSTGQGVGVATAKNILERLKGNDKHKAKNQRKLKKFIKSSYDVLEKMYRDNKRILLEGTQGTGLSIHHGLYPHVTSRDTTVDGCLSEAGISGRRVNKVVMVTRTYPIRVGGESGPFISNPIDIEEIARRSGKNIDILKKTEITTTTKKPRRFAEFSWSLFRKACELNSPTDIALTFVDYIHSKNADARRYDQLTQATRLMIEEIERCSGVKVSLISTCFDYRAIIDRRNWK